MDTYIYILVDLEYDTNTYTSWLTWSMVWIHLYILVDLEYNMDTYTSWLTYGMDT